MLVTSGRSVVYDPSFEAVGNEGPRADRPLHGESGDDQREALRAMGVAELTGSLHPRRLLPDGRGAVMVLSGQPPPSNEGTGATDGQQLGSDTVAPDGTNRNQEARYVPAYRSNV